MIKAKAIIPLLLLCTLSLFVVGMKTVDSQYSEIIYIAPEGISPETAPIQKDGNLYVFTENILDYSIVVLMDNIIVDGAGYTLEGGGEVGIDLTGRSNVTIRNLGIRGFYFGINLAGSSNSLIVENKISAGYGITIQQSSNGNTIEGNEVRSSNYGIYIDSSSNSKIQNNKMEGNSFNFVVYGNELSHFAHQVESSNTVDGKNTYYLVNGSNLVIDSNRYPNIGFLALVNCTGATIQDLELSNNGQGIMMAYTTSVTIAENTLTDNLDGIWLFSCSENTVLNNNIKGNYGGIKITQNSQSNSISRNNITGNNNGITLFASSANMIIENNITGNNFGGVVVREASNNILYGNRFVENSNQVYDVNMDDQSYAPSLNIWDAGYPLGGNHWSDYIGIDEKSGPNQDQPGSDGIGDTPFSISLSNKDNYPLGPFYGVPDEVAPVISIISPENTTYTQDSINLIFTVDRATSWIGYSLNGENTVPIVGNVSLSPFVDGSYNIVVHATDTEGNTGISEVVYFNINTQAVFPTIVVAVAIIVIVIIALAVIIIKKRKQPEKEN